MAVVDKNKLLGKAEKGGDLMVRPTTSLVGSPGGKITETSDEKDVVHTISIKLVKVDKFLKGNLDAEKAAQKKEQKQKEDELRGEQEQDKEKPDKDQEKETPKSLIPKMSFLDGIKKFLGNVLMGWLTFRLIKFLPKIVKLLKPIAAFTDWVLKWGGKLLDGLVSFIDWGYKALDDTKKWIGEKFGDGAAEKFDSFMGTLTKVMNLVMAVGLASSAMGLGDLFDGKNRNRRRKPQDFGPDGKPRVKPKPKAKWKVNLQKWWKNTPVGKFLRNAAAIRKKLVRKLQQRSKKILTNVGEAVVNNKTVKNITNIVTEVVEDPQKIIKAVTENKTVKNVVEKSDKLVKEGLEKSTKVIENVKGNLKETIQKVSDSDLAKNIKKIIPEGKVTKPGFFSKAKANLGSGWNWVKKGTVSNFNKTMKAAAEAGAALNKKWKSITAAASENFGKLTKAAQEALSKRILQPFLEFLQPVLKPLVAVKDIVLKKLTEIMPKGVLKKVGANSLSDAPKMLKKLGAKALPWIGGLFNAIFAYERFAQGDTVGGLLESTAAGLDIAGATWPASLSIDLYLFARDMFPESIMGMENDIIDKVPGATSIKGKVDGMMKKLPDLGELTKLITGGAKDPDIVNAGSGSETTNMENLLTTDGNSVSKSNGAEENVTSTGNAENILPLDVNSVSKKASNVSENASYEEGAEETIIIKSGSEQDVDVETDSQEKGATVFTGSSGGGDGSDEVSDALYKGG